MRERENRGSRERLGDGQPFSCNVECVALVPLLTLRLSLTSSSLNPLSKTIQEIGGGSDAAEGANADTNQSVRWWMTWPGEMGDLEAGVVSRFRSFIERGSRAKQNAHEHTRCDSLVAGTSGRTYTGERMYVLQAPASLFCYEFATI